MLDNTLYHGDNLDRRREVRMMSTRQPWHIFSMFNDVAPCWGEKLWSFLNEEDNVTAMSRASHAGRPAAEAIAVELYQRFGEDVRQDRVKQYTGLLIRAVMEANGYVHDRYHCTCKPNPVFKVASCYVRRQL